MSRRNRGFSPRDVHSRGGPGRAGGAISGAVARRLAGTCRRPYHGSVSNPFAPGYVLRDPRPIAEEAPYTFFLPGPAELAAIAGGDLVKLLFEHVPPGRTYDAERMWVSVDGAHGEVLAGALANEPFETEAVVRIGDRVTFERYHILAIEWADPENAPPPLEYREYWERCLVDASVVDGRAPVEYLYREEPDMAQEGDTYPDSGWRIRGRVPETTEAETGTETPQYVALGAVLNRDDSWLHLIDAPIGAAYLRDRESDVYMPAED